MNNFLIEQSGLHEHSDIVIGEKRLRGLNDDVKEFIKDCLTKNIKGAKKIVSHVDQHNKVYRNQVEIPKFTQISSFVHHFNMFTFTMIFTSTIN